MPDSREHGMPFSVDNRKFVSIITNAIRNNDKIDALWFKNGW
jgi:hypothetical protein